MESLEEILDDLGHYVVPRMIEFLLDEGELDPARLDDPTHVLTALRENAHRARELTLVKSSYDDFVATATEALEHGRIAAAVVLVVTAIEHLVNGYLEGALARSHRLNQDDINQMLRTNFHAKLGWMSRLAGLDMDESLCREVLQLVNLRNKLVHLRSEMMVVDEDGTTPTDVLLARIDPSRIVLLPDRLGESLNAAVEQANPNRRLATETYRRMAGTPAPREHGPHDF